MDRYSDGRSAPNLGSRNISEALKNDERYSDDDFDIPHLFYQIILNLAQRRML